MRDRKFLRKLLIASLAAGSLIFTPEIYGLPTNAAIVHAEVMEYVGVGESIVSDRETLDIGKQGARLQAIRNAQEKAGIFISSHSVMRDHELESDEVVAFTASVVKISDDIKYEPIQVEQWIKYRATVVVTIDTDDLTTKVNQWLGINSQDRSTLTERSRDLNTTLDRIKTRTVEIETAVAGASSTVDATQIQAEIKELDRDILYAQKISEGNEFLRSGDRASAMRLYQEAIAIYPKDATIAYEKLGDSYLEAKDYTRAIDAYTKVIQMDPNYSVPYFKRGKIYLELEDYRQAVDDFTKAIEIAPNSFEAYVYRCLAYINLGKHDAAIKDYRKAYPNSNSDRISIIIHCIQSLNERIKNDRATAYDYFTRGVYYRELPESMGADRLAIQDYTKAIELNPNDSEYLCERGEIYMRMNNYQQAVKDLEKSFRLKPTYYSCRRLGECYEKIGDKAKAIDIYKKALKEKAFVTNWEKQQIKLCLKQLESSN